MLSQGKDKHPGRRRAHDVAGNEAKPVEVAAPLGPGSKERRGQKPKDPVRVMLLERIRERGVTIADLSRALQRNEAYMHQFIWRASPQWLGEADRAVICQMLEIPETLLRPPMPDAPSPMRLRQSLAAVTGTDQREVPLFREDDLINLTAVREWTHRIPGLPPGAVFALWIAQEHTRFGPGTMVHVHQRQPPRIGDQVVVLADDRVVAIGELIAIDGVTADLRRADGQDVAAPAGASIHKVVAAVFP